MTARRYSSAISSPGSCFGTAPFTPQHSPTSMVFNDFSRDETGLSHSTQRSVNRKQPINSIPVMADVPREDVSGVLQNVLVQMEQVVEHLRDKGENNAANTISKNMIAVVSTFNEATAPWNFDQFFMKSPTLRASVITAGKGRLDSNVASTWASIAAKSVNGRNSLIKFHPSDGVKKAISQEQVNNNNENNQDMRVVWIQGWPQHRPLAEITENLSQGPILSMVYSEEYGAVCVIFHNSRSVRELLEDEEYHRERKGKSIFGPGHTIVPGLPYPESEDIRRMNNPSNERRRLTFARSQLFAHGMTEQQFKQDIFNIVGETNVELVWLFNTGNATVVFTSTAIARLVRNEFRKLARVDGPYRDVQVTFSHDPCERPLNLITQIPGCEVPRVRAPSNTSNNSSGASDASARGLRRQQSKRKNQMDADGWQTVIKKR